MQGLGRTQNVNQIVNLSSMTLRRASSSTPDGGWRVGQKAAATTVSNLTGGIAESSETRFDQQPESPEVTAKGAIAYMASKVSHRSFRDWLRDVLDAIDSDRRTPQLSTGDTSEESGQLDRTFGVEPLSYKNMWKVLKTVVREIGDIKEAYIERFSLGVNERLEKASTLMEFGSLADYLTKRTEMLLEDMFLAAAKESARQIMSNPSPSLDVQANIVPETALHLVTQGW